jgi:hypothetical protein
VVIFLQPRYFLAAKVLFELSIEDGQYLKIFVYSKLV